MLGVVMFGLLILFSTCMWITMVSGNMSLKDPAILKLFGYTAPFPADTPIPSELHQIVGSQENDIKWIIWHNCFIATGIGSYILIGFFGYQMVVYTKRNLNPRVTSEQYVYELNKQLTLNLIIQVNIL